MSKSNEVSLSTLTEGDLFHFPKGNKVYRLLSMDVETAMYSNVDTDIQTIYDCPASHKPDLAGSA